MRHLTDQCFDLAPSGRFSVTKVACPRCRGSSENAAGRQSQIALLDPEKRAMIKMMSTATIAFAGAALLSLAQPAFGQTDDKTLGTVHFETSCSPEAQKLFDRGMLYQHSFWYRASQNVFEDVLKADPACGIADWGVALSLLWNPHIPPPAKNLAEGAAALAKAKSIGAGGHRSRWGYTADVADGSKGDLGPPVRDVCSTPDNRHRRATRSGPFSARSGHQSAETFGGPADVSAGVGHGSPTEDDADKPRDW